VFAGEANRQSIADGGGQRMLAVAVEKSLQLAGGCTAV
jgi:hypothetical protein